MSDIVFENDVRIVHGPMGSFMPNKSVIVVVALTPETFERRTEGALILTPQGKIFWIPRSWIQNRTCTRGL